MGPIQYIVAELGRDYGTGAVYAVYAVGLLIVLLPFFRKKKGPPG